MRECNRDFFKRLLRCDKTRSTEINDTAFLYVINGPGLNRKETLYFA